MCHAALLQLHWNCCARTSVCTFGPLLLCWSSSLQFVWLLHGTSWSLRSKGNNHTNTGRHSKQLLCCNARFTRTVLGTSHPVASVSKCLQFCASNPLCIAMAWNPSGSPACFIALGKTGPVMFPGASGTNGQKVCVKRTVQVMDTPVGADAVIARCGLDSRNLNNSASGSFGMEPTMRMVSTIEACSTSEARCFTDGIVLCASQTAVPAKTLDSFNCSRSGGTTASATPAPAVTTAPLNQQPQSTGERTPFTDGFTSDVDNFFKSLDMSIVLMVTIPIGVVVLLLLLVLLYTKLFGETKKQTQKAECANCLGSF